MKNLSKKIMTMMTGALMALGICGCSQYDDVGPKKSQSQLAFVMPQNAIVMAEQSRKAIIVMDMNNKKVVWSWDPVSAAIPTARQDWFVNPSECKPVLNNEYVLMTASGGAVALIRFSDKKVMYYANCGTNPHSAEILPDGNVVTAESNKGEINLFSTDIEAGICVKKSTIKLGNAHNVVWDAKRNCLYATATMSAGVTAVFKLEYNDNKQSPAITSQKRLYTFENERGGHDLFPVYGEDDKLWLTAASAVYQLNLSGSEVACEKVIDMPDVKSVDSDEQGNVYLLKPTEEWWAPGPVDANGNVWFSLNGAHIYKFRIVQNNNFSYQ